MKAVILAAGKGTRMLPLTKDTPKPLLTLHGKPFLQYVLEHLQQAGYDEICLIVGHLQDKIRAFCAENNFSVTFVEQSEALGTGHAVLQAEEFVGDDQFIVLGGDNLWSANDLKAIWHADELQYVGVIEKPHDGKYGVIEFADDFLVRIAEKEADHPSTFINTGLYKCTKAIFAVLKETGADNPQKEIYLTEALNTLAKEKKVKIQPTKDYWLDLGAPEDIPIIEQFMEEQGL